MNFNDDLFRLLQAFIDENQGDYESIDATVAAFMEQYNKNIRNNGAMGGSEISPEAESMMLMDEAEAESSPSKRRKLLKKALELWPENFEAEILLEQGDVTSQLKAFARIEKREKDKWSKKGLVGWLNWEERPYWRLKQAYASYLFDVGLLLEAEKHFLEMLAANEMDNLGSRYNLMSIYARTYQWEKGRDLFAQVEDAEHDMMMLVPMLCLAVAVQEYAFAKLLLRALLAFGLDLKRFFRDEVMPIEFIMANGLTDHYQPNSIQELSVAFYPLSPMLFGAEYIYQWLRENYQALTNRSGRKSPKQAGDFADNANVIKFPDGSRQENFYANEQFIASPFDGVYDKPREILEEHGFKTFEDFAKVTRASVAEIYGIGQATMKRLVDNGVTFKKK